MRARNLKPGFFKNEELAKLSPMARLLFAGLWCYADREGRFEWRPKRIKVEILPYEENCDINRLLMSLHDKKLIVKYNQNGDNFGFIPNFLKHQNPHPHEAKSNIPSPPEEIVQQLQCHDVKVTCNEMSIKCNADSLNPSSLNPSSKTIAKQPKKPVSPEVKIFIDFYHEEFKTRFGTPPLIQGGKDGKVVKELLEKIKLDELKILLNSFFDSDDPFIQKSGYTIGVFKSQINKLKIGSPLKDGTDMWLKIKEIQDGRKRQRNICNVDEKVKSNVPFEFDHSRGSP